MRQIWILFLPALVVGCQQKAKEQTLSAKDTFELRTKCKVLADKWKKDNETEGFVYVVRSHYDEKTNRCLVKGRSLSEVILLDAQTNVVLADCNTIDGKVRCELHGIQDLPKEHVWNQIDKMMGDDSD